MLTNNSSKRPATTLRCGNIKMTIWQNISEKGPFFATTFLRPFEDQSGFWRNCTSFGLNDLEALMNVAFEAKGWIATHDVNGEGFPGKSQAFRGFLREECNTALRLLH